VFEQGKRLLARFALIEHLGGDAGAQVWRALDESSGVQVALKVVAGNALSDAACLSLQREHAIASRLHAAVPDIRVVRTDAPMHDDEVWLLPMQLASGDATRLRGKPAAHVLSVLIDVAEALSAAHRQGVIHRDLKPGNVLLDFRGRALLTDFGVASLDGVAPAEAAHARYSTSPQQASGAPPSVADDVYGFGALAYELLRGYPPAYPHERLDAADLQEGAFPHPLPAALLELLRQALAQEPGDRPRDMGAVLQALRAVDLSAHDVDGAALLDRIVPADLDALRSHDAMRPRGSWHVWFGAGALLAALAAVFFWLPKFAIGTTTVAQTARSEGVSPDTARALLSAASADEQRRRFGDARKQFETTLQALEQRAAGVWGGAAFGAAKALGESAYAAERAGEYELAIERMTVAQQRLGRVEAERVPARDAQLSSAARALEESALDRAKSAYELAAQIDPGNAEAAKALARIAKLAPVLDRLADAEAALLNEDALHALQLFEQVLRADGENRLARNGAARARDLLGSDRYAREIGEALRQLRAGQPQQARAALARAKVLRPEGVEVREGLIALDALGARTDLDTLRRNALALESGERWAEALAQYESLLTRDPTLVFARESAVRVRPRAELARRLEMMVTKPERLSAPEVRAEADALITKAAAVIGEAPRLRAQVSALRAQLQRYDSPVRLVIQSDGATRIVIQKLREIGAVSKTELALKPGRYVLLGTREGFRDVRREVVLVPGDDSAVIELRCTEAIPG